MRAGELAGHGTKFYSEARRDAPNHRCANSRKSGFFCSTRMENVLRAVSASVGATPCIWHREAPVTAADLTPRDRELLAQLLSGRTASEIARKSGIAPSTMGFRVMDLKERIGVRTLLQLGAWCERHGVREAGAQT